MTDTPKPKLPGARPVRKRERNLGTVIAVFGVLLGGGFLMGLTAMVMPNVLGLVGIVFGSAVFFMLHYVTWGRWLMNRRRPVEDE